MRFYERGALLLRVIISLDRSLRREENCANAARQREAEKSLTRFSMGRGPLKGTRGETRRNRRFGRCEEEQRARGKSGGTQRENLAKGEYKRSAG